MNNKYFIVLLTCLSANLALADDLPKGIKKADLPVYSPNHKISLWVGENRGMEGASETAYFYSDGTYCYSLGAMGTIIFLKGQWQFNQDNTGINVKFNHDNDNQFFLEVNDATFYDHQQEKTVTRPNTLTLPELFFYKQPVYLGFDNQTTPSEMVLFDYDKYQDNILVPNDSRYLFVGSKITDGQVSQIARFDLSMLAYNPYNIGLMSNRSVGISIDELNSYFLENGFDYIIQNGNLGVKNRYSNDIDFFSETVSVDLDVFENDDNDDMDFKRMYGYCSDNTEEFYFDVLGNKRSNLTKPTYLNWRGKINPTADWLKPQD